MEYQSCGSHYLDLSSGPDSVDVVCGPEESVGPDASKSLRAELFFFSYRDQRGGREPQTPLLYLNDRVSC
jgi:hypothetical protein